MGFDKCIVSQTHSSSMQFHCLEISARLPSQPDHLPQASGNTDLLLFLLYVELYPFQNVI